MRNDQSAVVGAHSTFVFLIATLALIAYPPPVPWCLSGVENYVPPNPLYYALTFLVISSAIFGPAFAGLRSGRS